MKHLEVTLLAVFFIFLGIINLLQHKKKISVSFFILGVPIAIVGICYCVWKPNSDLVWTGTLILACIAATAETWFSRKSIK